MLFDTYVLEGCVPSIQVLSLLLHVHIFYWPMNDFINGNKIVNEFISRLCPFLLSFFTMKMFQHFYKLDFQGLFQQVMFNFWQNFRNEKPVLFFIIIFFLGYVHRFKCGSVTWKVCPWTNSIKPKTTCKNKPFFLSDFHEYFILC